MGEEILQAEEGAMLASRPLQLAESAPCMQPQRCENLRNDALIPIEIFERFKQIEKGSGCITHPEPKKFNHLITYIFQYIPII